MFKHLAFLLLSALLCTRTLAIDAAQEREQHGKELQAEFAQQHPDLAAQFQAGREAYSKGDYKTALATYSSLYEKVPDNDVVMRRFGTSLINSGQREQGMVLLKRALDANRSADNLSTYGYYLAFEDGKKPDPANVSEAIKLHEEALTLPHGTSFENLLVLAELQLRQDNARPFVATAERLAESYPDEMGTHYISAIAAATDEDWWKADREIRKAHDQGLDDATFARFLDSGVRSKVMPWKIGYYMALIIGIWVAGFGLLFGSGFALSRAVMRETKQSSGLRTINLGEQRLRSVYRVLINITGAYYYISLPFVAVLVFGLAGLLIYGVLAVGFIAIKLFIIFGIGAFVTLSALVRSLFVKVSNFEPGRPLTREEAPALWDLVEEVARDVDTRPVDEIRITAGTDVAVYERGSWREKAADKAKRVLILGAGLLNDFKIDAFRAVLAHEYGHFNNRDTAGGDVALRVRKDMLNFYIAMYNAGQARPMNIAFQFLRLYDFLFRRISHGATRLQEVLADRVAARLYGKQAFEDGLRHAIKSAILFDKLANREANLALKKLQPLQNLYDVSALEPVAVDEAYEKAIQRPTTDDDTHPGPLDRFELLKDIEARDRTSRSGVVWDLFKDRQAIIQEMMKSLEMQIKPQREHNDPLRKA